MVCWYGWLYAMVYVGAGLNFVGLALIVVSWWCFCGLVVGWLLRFCVYGIDLDFSVGGWLVGDLVLFAICGCCGL